MLYARTGDVRALTIFYASNICLAPLGACTLRGVINLALRPLWDGVWVENHTDAEKAAPARRSSGMMPMREANGPAIVLIVLLGMAAVEAFGAGAGFVLPGEEDDLWML